MSERSPYEEAALLVEGLRVHVDDDPHSTCPDGCGWFNYAAMKLREADGGWTPCSTPPPEGVVVEVRTPGGDERPLIFDDGLWWIPSREMYVYFTPTHWRSIL